MKSEKKYYSIKEVSKMLGIKQHVIRHWDSIDPKTNKPRIDDISIRTKGGTRFFSNMHINKLLSLKNLLKENGKRNYSLDLASKIISQNKDLKNPSFSKSINSVSLNSPEFLSKINQIKNIKNKLKNLIIDKKNILIK